MTDNQPAPDGNAVELQSIVDDLKDLAKPAGAKGALKALDLLKTVLWFLGIALIMGVAGWIWLAIDGKSIPGELGVIIGTIAGGLVGVIANPTSDSGS